jgi:hypothetical protein
MEISTVIKSLNELEKLKILLFDKNQLEIFERIPKPFLIDALADGAPEPEEEKESSENNIKK